MKQVIIADDSSLARLFINRSITAVGFSNFEIIEAKDGVEVVALATENRPDLIITDLNMPEMNGLEVLSKISKFDPPIPTIVVTSAGSENDKEKLRELGATAILTKPINPTDLSDAIGTILEKSEAFYD